MSITDIPWTQMQYAPSPLYGWQLDANITGAATGETQFLGTLDLDTDGVTYVGPTLPYGPQGRLDDGKPHAWRFAFIAGAIGGSKLRVGLNVRQGDGSFLVVPYTFQIVDNSGSPTTINNAHAVTVGWAVPQAGATTGDFLPELSA